MIDRLNEEFGIDGHINFQSGKGHMPKAVIVNEFSFAEIYLHGAHVTSFKNHNSAPILWLSDIAEFRYEKAIRGGIPIVWPWFGPHPSDNTKPQHGFARVSEWTPVSTSSLTDGRTQLCLQLRDDEKSRAIWPYSFELDLKVTVGSQLQVELISINTGTDHFLVGGALHTYFNIGDVNLITIDGLEGKEYLDQLLDHRIERQIGSLTISTGVDRIYVNTNDECVISDPVMNRIIRIAKKGSNSTVVWNPWIDKSQRMPDFPNDGYLNMICIETSNAGEDTYNLQPDEEHTLAQIISINFQK